MNITTDPVPTAVSRSDDATVCTVELPSPQQCFAQHPLSAADAGRVATHREVIGSILRGQDKRLLAIVGPCSVHSVEQALDYADQLAAVRSRFEDALFIAMRVYIEKPRTTVGWRGLAFDPALDLSQGPDQGLHESRRVMNGVVQRGLPVATESLDPFIVPYVEDLLAFSSLGARTSESQTHRQMAAAMDCPIGIKNATSGSLGVAADAAKAVGSRQTVFNVAPDGRVGCQVVAGNRNTAIVLRGGASGPNYRSKDQAQARQVGMEDTLDCLETLAEAVRERSKRKAVSLATG